MTTKSIAQQLALSRRTVETYLISVKNKLHCDTTAEMLDLYHALNLEGTG